MIYFILQATISSLCPIRRADPACFKDWEIFADRCDFARWWRLSGSSLISNWPPFSCCRHSHSYVLWLRCKSFKYPPPPARVLLYLLNFHGAKDVDEISLKYLEIFTEKCELCQQPDCCSIGWQRKWRNMRDIVPFVTTRTSPSMRDQAVSIGNEDMLSLLHPSCSRKFSTILNSFVALQGRLALPCLASPKGIPTTASACIDNIALTSSRIYMKTTESPKKSFLCRVEFPVEYVASANLGS